MLYEPFERIDVDSWRIDRDETSGVEEKIWLLEPQTDPPVAWLFKRVMDPRKPDRRSPL